MPVCPHSIALDKAHPTTRHTRRRIQSSASQSSSSRHILTTRRQIESELLHKHREAFKWYMVYKGRPCLPLYPPVHPLHSTIFNECTSTETYAWPANVFIICKHSCMVHSWAASEHGIADDGRGHFSYRLLRLPPLGARF